MTHRAIAPVLVTLATLSCAADEPQPEPIAQCDVATRTAAVQAADRKILGLAAAYPADRALRVRAEEFATSRSQRRALAWQVAARVLSPVPVIEELPNLPAGVAAEVPRWLTWYARDDISRLFHHLYEELDPAQQQARERFSPDAVDRALGWNTRAVEELDNWPKERWDEYVAAIASQAQLAGIGGLNRVAYSESAARHVLASYPEILQCMANGPPAPFIEQREPGESQVIREEVALDPCEERTYGRYELASGDPLTAVLERGGASSEDVVLIGRRVGDPTPGSPGDGQDEVCRARGDEVCTVVGPGEFTITVSAGPGGHDDGDLVVGYRPARPLWAACLRSPFSGDAAVIKAAWRRAQFGLQLPVYDTSADGLSRRLGPGETADWGPGDGMADPGPEDIFTTELPNGSIFRLAGLHIMTKELDHWLWITLWWSAEPDSDFGADRSDAMRALGGPWGNYKMCVVTAFEEGDLDPDLGDSAPSLAAALAATYTPGGPSWCSNPYIEIGPGNADTNCIGCHQHAGTGLLSTDIIADPTRFPAHGRTELRNNFPSDYLWAVDDGERLGRMFADVVEYYDGAP